MASATITSKGQVTIPKEVRESLMLGPGDKIEFVVTEKREALIRPVSRKVDEIFGILHKPGRKAASAEEVNEGLRKRLGDDFR